MQMVLESGVAVNAQRCVPKTPSIYPLAATATSTGIAAASV
jgi:hypothetical protein